MLWMGATWKKIRRDRQLILLFIPCILFYAIFRYAPLYGLIIAFKDYSVFQGIVDSPWVGLKHFDKFFSGQDFEVLFKNTLLLGFYTLIFGFPFPIVFAILLNEVRTLWFKKTIQTFSYLPAFLSVVIISSMLIDFLSPNIGIINRIIAALGFEKTYFLIQPEWFRTIYVASDIWSTMGYEAIIYLAAIAGISPTLYEAAKVDGAGRFRAVWSVTLPSILPTILIMFILKTGSMIRVGYEKVLMLYNPATYEVADVFSTFVYRKGLLESNYSYAAAVGMFEALIAMIMVLSANFISKKAGGRGIW
ncbi:ABC transporter permease [Cohnella soli]|uniref:ABC transporter permease n=1 Tax=Cohnella soli TaxID=425005 RepID=A0ABW0HW80_9BACL